MVRGCHRHIVVRRHQAILRRSGVRNKSHVIQQRDVLPLGDDDGRTPRRLFVGNSKGKSTTPIICLTSGDPYCRLTGTHRNGLHRGGRHIRGIMICHLHHKILTCIVERILQLNRKGAADIPFGNGQRRIIHRMHIRFRVGVAFIHRGINGIVRRHILHHDAYLLTRHVVRVCSCGESQGSDGTSLVACFGHQSRVENPLATVVSIPREREVSGRCSAHKTGAFHSRLLHASHTSILLPASFLRWETSRIVVVRRILCHTIERHQRVIAKERNLATEVVRPTRHLRHGHPDRRRVATHAVNQIH